MDYCAPNGIPYGEFLEWDRLSRDAAIAWSLRERERCGSCGQVKSDWMTEDSDGNPVELMPAPFVVEDHWCPGCEVLARHNSLHEKTGPPPGIHPAFRPASAPEAVV